MWKEMTSCSRPLQFFALYILESSSSCVQIWSVIWFDRYVMGIAGMSIESCAIIEQETGKIQRGLFSNGMGLQPYALADGESNSRKVRWKNQIQVWITCPWEESGEGAYGVREGVWGAVCEFPWKKPLPCFSWIRPVHYTANRKVSETSSNPKVVAIYGICSILRT